MLHFHFCIPNRILALDKAGRTCPFPESRELFILYTKKKISLLLQSGVYDLVLKCIPQIQSIPDVQNILVEESYKGIKHCALLYGCFCLVPLAVSASLLFYGSGIAVLKR